LLRLLRSLSGAAAAACAAAASLVALSWARIRACIAAAITQAPRDKIQIATMHQRRAMQAAMKHVPTRANVTRNGTANRETGVSNDLAFWKFDVTTLRRFFAWNRGLIALASFAGSDSDG
jgi:hypothetical protein